MTPDPNFTTTQPLHNKANEHATAYNAEPYQCESTIQIMQETPLDTTETPNLANSSGNIFVSAPILAPESDDLHISVNNTSCHDLKGTTDCDAAIIPSSFENDEQTSSATNNEIRGTPSQPLSTLEALPNMNELMRPNQLASHMNGQPNYTLPVPQSANTQQFRSQVTNLQQSPHAMVSATKQNLITSPNKDGTPSYTSGSSDGVGFDSTANAYMSSVPMQGSYGSLSGNSRPLVDMKTINLNVLNTNFALQIPVNFEKIEVKLFVGRLPRNFEEPQLTPLFTPFGEVVETVIIRDKASGLHKGSGFVKMGSLTEADAAVRALHGVKMVDQQLGPIQVKYANGEPERLGFTMDAAQAGHNLGKLFVGSLPRNITEPELRSIFENFGSVEEVVLMKDNNTGQLKGCAFVKFTYKEQAIHAIKTLHGQVKLPTCPRPLEVKFAENRRAAVAAGTMAPGGGSHLFNVPPHPVFLGKQQSNTNMVATNMAFTANPANNQVRTGSNASRVQQHAAMGASISNTATIPPSNLNPRTVNGWTEYFTADGRPYYHHTLTKVTQWTKPVEFNRVAPYVMHQNLAASPNNFHNPAPCASSQNIGGTTNISNPSANTSMQSSSDVSGPPGANVFVFHIPNEWGQNEVVQNFSQFGRVLSCYVATDRATGRNKGYGFISYDDVQAAANAVISMNGYPVGSKRLKVSIKTGEESYAAPMLSMLQQHHQQQQFSGQQANTMMLPNASNVSNVTPTGANAYSSIGMYHSMNNPPANPGATTNSGNLPSGINAYRATPY